MLLLVQTLLSSRHLPKNLKIIIYKTIIFPVLLYGCEARSLASREERSSGDKAFPCFNRTQWES